MTSFIDDLEHELRAASTRSMRLAAARAPRPSASMVAISASIAVCIAVVVIVLGGHSTSRPPLPGKAPTSPSAPASPRHKRIQQSTHPTHNPVIVDCQKHGSLTTTYTTAQLNQALATLAAQVRQYANCARLIKTALASQQSVRSGNPTTAGRTDPVVVDCKKHGSLTAIYSTAQLHKALATMPAPVQQYTNCAHVIKLAIRSASAHR